MDAWFLYKIFMFKIFLRLFFGESVYFRINLLYLTLTPSPSPIGRGETGTKWRWDEGICVVTNRQLS